MAYIQFSEASQSSSPTISAADQNIIAARNAGLRLRDAMRVKYLARVRKSKPKIAARKHAYPIRTKAARAPRSQNAHGGTRRAADDGGGGSSDGDSSGGGDKPRTRLNLFAPFLAIDVARATP